MRVHLDTDFLIRAVRTAGDQRHALLAETDAEIGMSAIAWYALGMPRRRANDIAIGTTASACGAILWTVNRRDFEGVPGLRIGPDQNPSGGGGFGRMGLRVRSLSRPGSGNQAGFKRQP